jgi:MFS family permease
VRATLRCRPFALVWCAGLISQSGDWVLITALPYALYALTGSPLAAGLIWIAYYLPGLLFGSVAGVFVDRWDRRRTMVAVNLLQAGVLLSLLLVRTASSVWVAYLATFAAATLAQFFVPAEHALLPRLVGEEHLQEANALASLTDNLARIIGPALGGVALGAFGLAAAALLDSASFLLSAALIAAIVAPDSHHVLLWKEPQVSRSRR